MNSAQDFGLRYLIDAIIEARNVAKTCVDLKLEDLNLVVATLELVLNYALQLPLRED